MTIQQKITAACIVAGISQNELAGKMGTTSSAFSQRMKRGKFTDEDFQKIALALGAKYFSGFVFPDGTEIK